MDEFEIKSYMVYKNNFNLKMPKLNFLFAIFRGQNQIKLNIYQ